MSKPFKQTFPVLNESIISGRIVIPPEIKIFDIDNIAAYCLANDFGDFSLQEDVGPLRLPYPSMWMEHSTHEDRQKPAWDEGQDHATLPKIGWLLAEHAPNSIARIRLLAKLQCPDLAPDQHIISAISFDPTGIYDDLVILSWVTSAGEWVISAEIVERESVLGKRVEIVSHMVGQEASVAFARHIVRSLFDPIAMAIGLANCKNIAVDDMATRKERKSRRASKQRFSGTEYKVIRLPGAPSNRIDGNVPTGRESRLHTVRGHFKTYTDDNPLFGRLTGTWWWPPTARGNKKNGEIISTYKQSVPQK